MKRPFFCLKYICTVAVLSGLIFLAISTTSKPAYALTAGCDGAKWNELQSLAEVRAAYDVGITEQTIPKPDSVLALTCFAEASQISAKEGGDIFSGAFEGALNDVIEGTVTDMLGNFAGSLLDGFLPGGMGGLVGGLAGLFGLAPAFSCDNMADIWQDTLDSGISQASQFLDLDSILDIGLGGGGIAADLTPDGVAKLGMVGNILKDNLLQQGGAAAVVQAALAAAPIAIPVMDTDANGNGHLDVCDVMRNLTGVMPAGC